MSLTLQELVDGYYKNSPAWPLPVPSDMDAEASLFFRDDCRFAQADVKEEIIKFWQAEQVANH